MVMGCFIAVIGDVGRFTKSENHPSHSLHRPFKGPVVCRTSLNPKP